MFSTSYTLQHGCKMIEFLEEGFDSFLKAIKRHLHVPSLKIHNSHKEFLIFGQQLEIYDIQLLTRKLILID